MWMRFCLRTSLFSSKRHPSKSKIARSYCFFRLTMVFESSSVDFGMNYNWASAWDFQQCGMCDQQSIRSACAYAQSDQSLCLSLEYTMIVKLLTEHHLELLSFKGGCIGSYESSLVKMSHCWKSHATAQLVYEFNVNTGKPFSSWSSTYAHVHSAAADLGLQCLPMAHK